MNGKLIVLGLAGALAGCGPGEPTGRDYVTHCVSVLVTKQHADPLWRGSEASTVEPKIVEAGPPKIVRCAATLRSGEVVTYDISVRCENGLEGSCSAPRT